MAHFLSAIHPADQVSMIQRNQRLRIGGYQLVDAPAHEIIDHSNANVGGIDRNEQLTSILKNH